MGGRTGILTSAPRVTQVRPPSLSGCCLSGEPCTSACQAGSGCGRASTVQQVLALCWLKTEPQPAGKRCPRFLPPPGMPRAAQGWPLLLLLSLFFLARPGSLPWKRPAPAWVGCTWWWRQTLCSGRSPGWGSWTGAALHPGLRALWLVWAADHQGPGFSRPASGQQVSSWLGRLGTQVSRRQHISGLSQTHASTPQLWVMRSQQLAGLRVTTSCGASRMRRGAGMERKGCTA